MIKQLLLSFFLGSIITVGLMQNHKQVHRYCEQIFCQLLQISGVQVHGSIKKINLLWPSVTLTDVLLQHVDNQWQVAAKNASISFSWLELIGSGVIELHIALQDVKAVDSADRLGFFDYLETLLDQPAIPLPIALKTLNIDSAEVKLHAFSLVGTVSFSSKSKRMKNCFKTSAYVRNGQIKSDTTSYLTDGLGTVWIDVYPSKLEQNYIITTDCRVQIPQLETPTCFVTGTWDFDHGRFAIRSSDFIWSVDPIIFTKQRDNILWKAMGTVPAAYLAKLNPLPSFVHNTISGGSCRVQANGSLNKPYMDAYLMIEDLKTTNLEQPIFAKCSVHHNDYQWSGSAEMRHQACCLNSSWQWDATNDTGSLSAYNVTSIPLPLGTYWKINPYDGSIKLLYADNKLSGSYSLATTHQLLHHKHSIDGTFAHDTTWQLNGTCHDYAYAFDGQSTYPYVQHAAITRQNQPCITTAYQGQNRYHTTAHLPFLCWLSHDLQTVNLQADGTLEIDATLTDDTVAADLSLNNGTVRLPQTYNFINGFSTQLVANITQKKLSIKEMLCTLHAGTVYCPRATFFWDENGKLINAYAPCLFNHCMLNLSRDLFAMLSGSLIFQAHSNTPTLSGILYLDRAQLKENIFASLSEYRTSSNSLSSLPGGPLNLDITVQTKDPIRIDTSFLQANARMNLHVCQTSACPGLVGQITLHNGKLQFPYKSLLINKGTLTFSADYPFDPMIEIFARNTLKRHIINLHVGGSLNNHYLTLDASPPLTEEQIVSLLLVGSHESSLTCTMPTLLAQNIQKALFSSSKHAWDHLNNWTKPFNITIIPNFTDQAGRGGLRGAIEIDVNERMHAIIQKNFNLTEDTRFEMEYLISDHISIRGTRDERRDIAGEIEMRWKF